MIVHTLIFLAVNSGGNLPRGIVTATTVPKGSSFTSSPLPNTLQKQLQQAKPQAPAQSAAKATTDMPSKLSKANSTPALSEDAPQSASNTTSNAPASPDNRGTQDKSDKDSSSALPPTTTSGNYHSKSGGFVVSTTSNSSLSSSSHHTEVTASSLTSQLLDAHSLLQQQGAGASTSPSRMTNSTLPLNPQELLAQVSSFLNLPSQTTPLPAVSGSVASTSASKEMNDGTSEPNSLGMVHVYYYYNNTFWVIVMFSFNAESLPIKGVLKGAKRPNTSQDLDSEHSVKKIHLEV